MLDINQQELAVFNGSIERETFGIMLYMQTLRNAKFLTRLVLVWFALFLGSAIAASIVKPGNLQMVCSSGGMMKLVDSSGDEGVQPLSKMDCPLCASVSAPPPSSQILFEKPSSLAHSMLPLSAAHIASATAPPLPSRGPPSNL